MIKVPGIFLIFSLLISFSVNAESDVKTVYQKNTVIDFNEVSIEGELTRPEGSYLMNRKQARFNKLYRIRGHFRQELIKSTDNL